MLVAEYGDTKHHGNLYCTLVFASFSNYDIVKGYKEKILDKWHYYNVSKKVYLILRILSSPSPGTPEALS